MLLAGVGLVLAVAGPGALPSWSEQTSPATEGWRPSPYPSRSHPTKSPTPKPSKSPSMSPSKSPSKSPTQSPTATASPTSLPVTGGASSGTITGLVLGGLAATGAGGLLVRAGRRRRLAS